MMMKQTRLVFDSSDIVAVRLQCQHCGREAVQPLKQTEVSLACPFCDEPWDCSKTGYPRDHEWQLIRAMQNIVGRERRMCLRFEIDADPEV